MHNGRNEPKYKQGQETDRLQIEHVVNQNTIFDPTQTDDCAADNLVLHRRVTSTEKYECNHMNGRRNVVLGLEESSEGAPIGLYEHTVHGAVNQKHFLSTVRHDAPIPEWRPVYHSHGITESEIAMDEDPMLTSVVSVPIHRNTMKTQVETHTLDNTNDMFAHPHMDKEYVNNMCVHINQERRFTATTVASSSVSSSSSISETYESTQPTSVNSPSMPEEDSLSAIAKDRRLSDATATFGMEESTQFFTNY